MILNTPELQRKRQISDKLDAVLRHRPENIGLTLDRHGWARIDELIEKFDKSYNLEFSDLEYVVSEETLNEYSFNEDKTCIRANYGHTLPVLFEHKEDIPPKRLYYGTNEEKIPIIEEEGLIRQDGEYVYLFNGLLAAKIMGSRYGKHVIYSVNCEKMRADGFKFYRAENFAWLAEKVPVEFIGKIDF